MRHRQTDLVQTYPHACMHMYFCTNMYALSHHSQESNKLDQSLHNFVSVCTLHVHFHLFHYNSSQAPVFHLETHYFTASQSLHQKTKPTTLQGPGQVCTDKTQTSWKKKKKKKKKAHYQQAVHMLWASNQRSEASQLFGQSQKHLILIVDCI